MRPPGYPAHLERDVTLRDGRHVFVRPIVPDDAAALSVAAGEADEETLYLRFFTSRPRLGPRQMRHLTEVDYRHRLALVAFDDTGRGVAVARYEGQPGSSDAEIAVVVDPAWRRLGLSAALLEMLETAAVAAGMTRLTALHLSDNRPAEAMLTAAGYGSPSVADGITTVVRELPLAPN